MFDEFDTLALPDDVDESFDALPFVTPPVDPAAGGDA